MLSIAYSIAPLAIIILAGVVAGHRGLVPSELRKGLSDFCYYFGMPALLIRTITSAPPGTTEFHLIWIAYLLPIVAVWIASTMLARERSDPAKQGAASIARASAYGNVIMLGIPLALTQFGPTAATPVALIILVHSPVLFLAAAVHNELAKSRIATLSPATNPSGLAVTTGTSTSFQVASNLGLAIREASIDLATNPIILAILAGLGLRLAGLTLPPVMDTALALLGQATLPCVLLAIGLGLATFKMKGELGVVGLISFLKLIALPAMAWFISAHILALPSTDVAVITLLSAMPTGAHAYVFATRQGAAEASVGTAVALTTIASAITITAILAVLGQSN
jgi:malonate transporter and related proteins